jgi:carboxyl-terminal processing protease
MKRLLLAVLTVCGVLLLTLSALAQEGNGQPSHSELQEALGDAQASEPEAERYLSTALDILERNFLRRDQVDWEAIRAAVLDLASDAVTAEDTYPAIELALEMMGERHSRFIPAEEATTPPGSYIGIGVSFSPSFTVLSVLPGGGAEAAGIVPGDTILAVNGEPFVNTMQILGLPEDETAIEITFRRGDGGDPQTLTVERRRFSTNLPPTGQRLENGIGYVQLPAHSGSGTFDDGRDYASMTQRLIEEIDSEETCGWVVDLRRNAGGNMWPMLAGIGPILGDGEVGSFVSSDSTTRWRYEGGRALASASTLASGSTRFRTSINYSLRQADPLVAVITSGSTASSGEAIVVAFKGRPHTRFFGEATNGIPTANVEFPLSDGAVLNLTVAFMADRTGETYDSPIEPDEVIEVDWERIGTDDDPVLEAALVWLNAEEGCQP